MPTACNLYTYVLHCLNVVQTKMAVVVDGFISGAAALAAVMLEPSAAPAVLLSHRSGERGAGTLLTALRYAGVPIGPPLHMGLRLGEGTGALLCVPMLGMACAMLKDMGRLEDTLALAGATAPADVADGDGC